DTLTEFGVPHESRVLSAHRSPDLTAEFVSGAEGRGLEVIIAGAGGAAHLAGVTAAYTTLPVLGVPMESQSLKGLDSLLSTVEMPDAADYGDTGSDTLGNIARTRGLRLPNLCRLGLANIKPIEGLDAVRSPEAAFGKCALASPGKDTTTGHWEMVGIHLENPF